MITGEIKAITMPKFGLAMTEGKVASWAKTIGAEVNVGDDLADIETTKITNAYESPVKGILRRQVAQEQEELPVGSLIAIIADRETSEDEIDRFIDKFQAEFVSEQDKSETVAAPEPRVIEVSGQKIRILEIGNGEGAPIVFVHGFGGDLNNWMFNQPPLAEKHRTIAIDLPGHGGSVKETSGDIASLAKSVGETLDALGVASAHFVGHSLGGAIILALALERPTLVASLSLISPAALGDVINTDYTDGFITADRRKTLKPVLQLLFADPSLVSNDMIDDLIKFKRLDGATTALTAIASANFKEGRQSLNLLSRLAEIKAPVEILWGKQDQVVPMVDPGQLPGTIAFHPLEKSGHMPQMEQSAEVNGLIGDFITKVETKVG
ncbi:acetoin dehydrogenase dihydrolipoyllysine-residue acetyltransferase subunit [Beijerinckia indica]|uniref:Alpha/beta hydrolase fold n=1 Tax=Beijerinckia indica subsp. indica (strain ATCC 9039 / DSM 1715 / NCIMB 8712) TaxID=395963 RepID=B2IBQ5_BEII9|nr:acetoin dehydrogenase dihydrolipoyllysine-residue acetyltransferase subunit [Beijerinckia indica]ACB93777.1 alpha/beta hydrolase fold [Beijerinckia indica subsp. indica ATCC 9039]